MSTLDEKIKSAMLSYLIRRKAVEQFYRMPDPVEVIRWKEDIPHDTGYCDTCGPDPITVEIEYLAFADPTTYSYFYYGSLGELITELTQEES